MIEITSQPLVILDTTDSRKLEVYITSNHPTVQIYDQNDGDYTPDWSVTNLQLSARVYLNSEDITDKINEVDATKKLTLVWTCKPINSDTESLTADADDPTSVTISSNVLTDANMVMTYICSVAYQNLTAFSQIAFSRTNTGLNGANGTDGTSVRILGTATSASPVSDTSYYTITYSDSAVVAAELGDAYLFNGELYVCAVKRDTDDYFINVGNIQGPAGNDGEDAKLITLNSSSQVFNVRNTGTVPPTTITPTTITITATAVNTSVSSWMYSTDGGATFSDETPTGLSQNGNTVLITGASLSVDSVVVKASDGIYSDTMTIHKVTDGAKGDPASMAFLTNENVSFSANANGQINTLPITCNVVAYQGVEKTMPVIDSNTISGVPSGMHLTVDSTSLADLSKEAIITISLDENTTLGSTSSNHGTITIPIISPVDTTLKLSWSKINAGPKGDEGVGINSVDVKYGTTTTITNNPESDITWGNTIPTVADGNYLWTRTRIDYTDPARDDTITYTYAKQGSVGEAGSSVEVVEIAYQAHGSADSAPTGTWSSAVVATSASKPYLWTRTTFTGGKIAYSVARYGKDGASGADAYTVLLTNESHVFAGDTANAIASTATTQVLVYKGTTAQTVTIVSVNGVTAATASTATGIAGLSFACSALSGTTPAITFTCTTSFVSQSGSIPIVLSVGGVSITKMFTYSIAFKGSTGATGGTGSAGAAATAYWLISDASVVQKSNSGTVVLTPSTLTFTGKSKTGTSAPADYACRWIIAYSTDGSTYTNSYTSSANEASKTFTVDSTYKSIRVRMYLAGGTSTLLDEQIIPVVADGAVGTPGMDAVTFQIYSSNGYALSTNTPNVTLQTFAYVGDTAITAGATYQWYKYGTSGWTSISGATNAYLTISRDDVAFSQSYMCKMTFNSVEYTSVATVDDKNDNNKVFTTKPSNYAAGDIWIVGSDYAPSGVEVGTLLKAQYTNTFYADADWIKATKYDDKLKDIQDDLTQYNQYFSFSSTDGVKITAKDSNGVESKYSTTISNDEWAINYGSEAVTYVNGTKMHIKEAEIESPLSVTGKYSGSTMLQAPIINIGNFSLVVESNGSLSVVVKS